MKIAEDNQIELLISSYNPQAALSIRQVLIKFFSGLVQHEGLIGKEEILKVHQLFLQRDHGHQKLVESAYHRAILMLWARKLPDYDRGFNDIFS